MRLWTNFFAASGAEYEAIVSHYDHQNREVLDIGCGNGRLAIKLSEKARAVTGIDLDEKLIDFASTYAESNGIGNLVFKTMSATELKFESNSFDLVIMPWMVHMLKDRATALAEVKRVLRPGGQLIIFGLWGDCDYDRIARHFVSRREQEIDPKSCYEEPLTEIFGAFECNPLPTDQSYSFIFPDCGVTVEAFNFAFKNWYGKTMNEKEINHLRHLLPTYGLGTHIELKTKGAIYLCTKQKASNLEQIELHIGDNNDRHTTARQNNG